MDSKIFDACYDEWVKNQGKKNFWGKLADQFSYKNGEVLRGAFKNERKKRGNFKLKEVKPFDYPRILCFDIETTPMEVYAFGLWNQNISPQQIISDSFVLSWSAKLLNSDEIYSDVLTSKEAKNKDDLRIVKSIWKLLDTCEILIGQNIKEFDLKKLNTRFLYYNLPPVSHYLLVDTLQVAKSVFSFPSNSLKYMNKMLGIKQKKENEGFILWKKCMDGDEESLKKMDEYCREDSCAVEDLYYRVRPFVKSHPNLSLYFNTEEKMCPKCGSEDVIIYNKFYYTPTGKYDTFRCVNCGAVSRNKINELDKDKRKNMLV